MTIKELSDLRNEFGDEFYVEKVNACYYKIVYKDIIVGDNLSSYEKVRKNVLKIKD